MHSDPQSERYSGSDVSTDSSDQGSSDDIYTNIGKLETDNGLLDQYNPTCSPEYCLTLKIHELLKQVADGRLTPSALYCLVAGVENVRRLCSQIALFLTVRPSELSIISCPKGLMTGQITFELNDGSAMDFSTSNCQTLPHADSVTAYLALLESGFRVRFPWAILATGKGYPYQLNARWAGLDCSMSRIGRWGLDTDRMIEFTHRDWKLGLRLLQHWAQRPALRRRMARMMYRGKKAELEIVTRFRGMLLDYVDSVV
ncbi:hypothetical protein H4R24_001004 [Coemansia sp. RSA 988]|nr:hypothetical protein H4R24_001004 [Coemansia sp. RSA 988]